MKSCTLLAVFIIGVVSSLFAVPSAMAQVVDTAVYYQPGASGATRIPRSVGSGGHLVTLYGPTSVVPQTTAGETLPVFTAPSSTVVVPAMGATPQRSYALVYVNVSGGADGGISIFPDALGNFPPTVPVTVSTPAQPIAVQFVYFPVGGSGSCPANTVCSSGAYIDEFSETKGALDSDYFVTAFSPPASTTANAGLTNTGNVYGAVDTTNSGVRINAYQSTTIGGIFDRWATGPGGAISGTDSRNLVVNQQTDDYALALYRSACPANSVWKATSTISRCVSTACPAGESWDASSSKCVPLTCGPGTKGIYPHCCPSKCEWGCYLPYVSPTGQPIWNCKPQPTN